MQCIIGARFRDEISGAKNTVISGPHDETSVSNVCVRRQWQWFAMLTVLSFYANALVGFLAPQDLVSSICIRSGHAIPRHAPLPRRFSMKRTILFSSLLAFAAHASAGGLPFRNNPGGPSWPSGVGSIGTSLSDTYAASGYGKWQTWTGYQPDVVTVWASQNTQEWSDIAAIPKSEKYAGYFVWAMRNLPTTTAIVLSMPLAPSGKYSNRNCANPSLWPEIASGKYDSYWKQFATNLKSASLSYGRDPTNMALRLGWEMNGDWYAWAICDKVSEFKTGWARVVNIIRAEIPGIVIDFSPGSMYVGYGASRNYGGGPGVSLAGFLPAANTFDVISYSVHDGHPSTVDETTWLQAQFNSSASKRQFGLNEVVTTAKSLNKKIALSEWGTFMEDQDSYWLKSTAPDIFFGYVYKFLQANQSLVAWDTHFSASFSALYYRQSTAAAKKYKELWSSSAISKTPMPPEQLSVN